MWKNWIEDDQISLQKTFSIDAQSDKFRIDRYIKNKEDAQNCINFLRDKYSELMTF
jgi:hypothetical protein